MGRKISATDGKTIAAFDFDGTITKHDTLLYFIWFAANIGQILIGSFLMFPSLLLYKLKLIPNYSAKEKLFKIFFGGVPINRFNILSDSFMAVIDKMVNPKAIEKIKWHQQMGHEVIIISASAENWIRPWAAKYRIETVLATQLEVKNQSVTGSFLTQNCHGAEKVCRLLKQYPDRDNYILYAYGDSNGDKELLSLADYSFYRSF
jgi:phosphatidylglycerophosphatase C